MEEEKYIQGNLRNLIRMTCLDLDGETSRKDIEQVLPIDQNLVKIWLDGEKMFFEIEGNLSFFILEHDGKFKNLDILKRVMLKFNIFLKGNGDIEKKIFQNDILMLLTK